MNLIQLDQRPQRTVARPAEVRGVGYLTGANVTLTFCPAPVDTGIVFVRTDLTGAPSLVAHIDNVTDTRRRTTLGRAPVQVALVEHALAALAGLRIDNCFVQVNAPEAPGLDGSAQAFVDALLAAGAVLQDGTRPILGVAQPVVVTAPGASLAFYPSPADELKVSYFLNYGPTSPIGPQSHTQAVTPATFAQELADCRTFVLESEALEFRRQGLGTRTTTADLLVIGAHGPLNNRLRHGNELVRHKVLDVIGDLALIGADLRGHVVAYRSGHPLNIALGRALTETVRHSHCVAA